MPQADTLLCGRVGAVEWGSDNLLENGRLRLSGTPPPWPVRPAEAPASEVPPGASHPLGGGEPAHGLVKN